MTEPVSILNDTIDPTVLAEVVCLERGNPDYVVTDWMVKPLSVKGMANPTGLLLVSGHGQDRHGGEISPWSIVLKRFSWQNGNPVFNDRPGDMFYWRRELALGHSKLLERLPGPVAVPRCFKTEEWEGGGQLWLEFIRDSSAPRWTLDQYRFAARQLGRMSGTCIAEGFFPDEPWLCRDHVRQWMKYSEENRKADGGWDFGSQIERAFPTEVLGGAIRLLEEKEIFFQAMDRLPRVFSHFDFQRRNLFIRRGTDAQDELVAVDWSFAGIGPLGGELATLVGSSALLFEIDPVDLPALESAAYPEYLQGLLYTGWDGDRDRLRLAYTAWLALWHGAQTPGFAGFFGAENGPGIALFECQPQEMLAGWAKLCEFALEHGEEARRLLQKLS